MKHEVPQDALLAKYPMVEKYILDSRAAVQGILTTDKIISVIRSQFDRLGSYEFARRHDLLVNNSGEKFAAQFMAFYNAYSNTSTY